MPKAAGEQLVRSARGPLDFEDLQGLLALVEQQFPRAAAPEAAGDDADAADASVPAEHAGEDGAGEGAPSLSDQLAALPAGAHEELWKRILGVAGHHLGGDAPAAPPAAPGEPSEEAPPAEQDDTPARCVHAVAFLVATFADVALDASKDAVLPGSFAEVLNLCQEMLLSIPDGRTQALIARALEKVCSNPFENKEDYYGGCLMYLIGKCLTPKTTSADVTRLYRVRHLLAELDWEHESIESLKLQLMRCIASPNFVRGTHGPDLVALCLTVHPGFVAEVHGTVKNQVMYSRQTVMKNYATALFKAWKASEGGTRIQLEQCVQDWVLLAVRTARKSADRARAVLEELHRHHHDDRLNELLCRLYGPVLWRSLKVANWQVRENAARLLQYTFPLIPNDLGVAEKEQELTRQLRLLRETLEDPAEPVRRVGVSAVCVILKNYWDLMPPAEIAELLTKLMNEGAKDKRAPMVRAAVAEGFRCIVQNPLSHPTMAAVLPQTAELLNDRSPLVRAAFINLLLAVSKCHGLSVGNIATTEQLLLRLVSEHTEGQAERLQKGLALKKGPTAAATSAADAKASPELVAKQLARLIAPSLFSQDLVQQVARCCHFMTNFPLALLALLTHLQDVVPVADRVKLAAALFRYGLRDASIAAGAGHQQKPRMVATMLRVVGVLLEGAVSEAPKQKKRKVAGSGSRLPKELESFVYEHIKEEDFLHLLKASHEDSGAAAARLREDLLFALSPLDPEQLGRTAELVQHELVLACRGAGAQHSLPQLTALMRTAVRWERLAGTMEAAWERLLAAAARLGRRQAVSEDLSCTLTVVEAAFRDPDVRVAVLRTEGAQLKQVIEAFGKSFCNAWSKGVAEVCSGGSKSGELSVLGAGSDRWPRVLGLVVREALHLEYRTVAASPPAAAAAAASEEQNGDEEAAAAAVAAEETPASPFAGLSAAVLGQLVEALTSSAAQEALEAIEASASQPSGGKRLTKKAKTTSIVPSDLDVVLQAHERVLEALNAANFLSVLRPNAAPSSEADIGCHFVVQARAMEASLWRWASAADKVWPLDGRSRVNDAWAFLGRMLQEMSFAEVPTPDLMAAIRVLLGRASDETPGDDELKKVIQALFQRLEYEPQLISLVAGVIGTDGAAPAQEVGQPEDRSAFNPRVAKVMEDVLPSFRNLRTKLRPQAPEPPASPGHDRRRILASPTPQKVGRATMDAREAREARERERGGESAAESGNEPPRSEAGRSDAARSDSLFDAVFNRESAEHSNADSGVDVD